MESEIARRQGDSSNLAGVKPLTHRHPQIKQEQTDAVANKTQLRSFEPHFIASPYL
jgi:hypothetical protein